VTKQAVVDVKVVSVKGCARLALTLAIGLLGAPTFGADTELFSALTIEPDYAYLAVTPCTGAEVDECVWHSLTCRKGSASFVDIDVIAGPIEGIASSMVTRTQGEAYAEVRLSKGATKVELRVGSIHLDTNELDGGWILGVGVPDPAPLFDALTPGSAEGSSILLGGHDLVLAPNKGDGAKLVAWKDACRRIEND